MRTLLVGDVHARPEDLDECWGLINYIGKLANQQQVARIVFLGDQNHYHGIVPVECLCFWQEAYRKLEKDTSLDIFALVGNHDLAGNGDPSQHSVIGSDYVTVVDKPLIIDPNTLLMPYREDDSQFVRECQEYPLANFVVCHQTFLGSKYHEGFYAKEGVDPNSIPQKMILSGHIHTPQSFDKVTYIGSPRWMKVTDANDKRHLAILDVRKEVTVEYFDTSEVCTPVIHLVDTPESPVELPTRGKITVDLKGPSAWIETRKKEFRAGIRFRTFPNDTKVVRVRESDGIELAFKKYFDGFKPPNQTPRESLERMLSDNGIQT